MRSFSPSDIRCPLTIALFLVAASVTAAAAAPAPEWRSRVGHDLLELYDGGPTEQANVAQSDSGAASVFQRKSQARFDTKGRVQIDAHFNCANGAPTAALKAAGLLIGTTVTKAPFCVVEGWISPSALPNLASVPGVKLVVIPKYAVHTHPSAGKPTSMMQPLSQAHTQFAPQAQAVSTPAIDGEAITIMRADQFIQQTSVNGTGVSVAVMSGDVSSLSVIQARGELPNTVQVIQPSANPTPDPSPTDEGTMMLEEVHAIAPGAALLFCGPQTSVEYVACLTGLAAAGATIVTDDLAYSSEDLMSASSALAQGVQTVLAQNPNLALFTVTENYNGSYWEGAYQPISTTSQGVASLTCAANGQIDYYINNFNGSQDNVLTVYAAGTYPVTFQWADPYNQNASNFDVYVVNLQTNAVGCISATGQLENYFSAPTSFAAGQFAIFVATPDQSLSGKFIKFWIGGDGATGLSPYTNGSVVSPQAFLAGVNTIGAVIGSDGIGSTVEPYSGRGPINLIFPAPMQIQAPSFVAPDAIYVDATGTNFASELGSDGFFHGTSAASPNAAGVAALLRSAFPSLTSAQITSTLQAGATYGTAIVPNDNIGYGRVDAYGALSSIPLPRISGFQSVSIVGGISIVGGSSSPALPFTLSGTGVLKVSTQDGASYFRSPTPSVTILPSNCGNPTINCTITLTPAIGVSGQTGLQVIVTDGANRSTSFGTTVTITKPPVPVISITSGANQSVTVGAALAPVNFTLTGTGPLTVSANGGGGANLPSVSSGCGSTTKACTVTLGNSSRVPGTATLSLAVQDSYGQTANASATQTQNAAPVTPSQGGGGAIDLTSLVGLVGLIALARRGRPDQTAR